MEKLCSACRDGPKGHAGHVDLMAPNGKDQGAFRCGSCGTLWAALPASFGGRAWVLVTSTSARPGYRTVH